MLPQCTCWYGLQLTKVVCLANTRKRSLTVCFVLAVKEPNRKTKEEILDALQVFDAGSESTESTVDVLDTRM